MSKQDARVEQAIKIGLDTLEGLLPSAPAALVRSAGKKAVAAALEFLGVETGRVVIAAGDNITVTIQSTKKRRTP